MSTTKRELVDADSDLEAAGADDREPNTKGAREPNTGFAREPNTREPNTRIKDSDDDTA